MTRAIGRLLTDARNCIVNPDEGQCRTLARIDELLTRLDDDRLRVAALGQFKRGKSTLLNALLGATLLPMGVTPVTAIPTFIRIGDATRARIVFEDGTETVVKNDGADISDSLAQFVSEAHNPKNEKRVASVAIETPAPLLEKGVILVDTPGVGSVYAHNTAAAVAALAECDAALFVLSADLPITEVEVHYLEKIRKLIPNIVFVLNKADQLDGNEIGTAERFLKSVLADNGFPTAEGIFVASSRRGLRAKTEGDANLVEESGIGPLERTLGDELIRRKGAILGAVSKARAIAIVGELLFQSKVRLKILTTPAEELREKAAAFETIAARFGVEREQFADRLSLDRKKLLRELEEETERIWARAKVEAHRIVAAVADDDLETEGLRKRIAVELSDYFEITLGEETARFHECLDGLVWTHRKRANELINIVRETAANLLDISASVVRSDETFQLRREPYWTAPESEASLAAFSIGALARLAPRRWRMKRARRRLAAETERAALRNIANLDWSLRQNIEEALRRFYASFAEQIEFALQDTRAALNLALERGSDQMRSAEKDVANAQAAVAALSRILSELAYDERAVQPTGRATC